MEHLTTTNIFVFHYKPGPVFPKNTGYVPVWAGKNFSTEETNLVGDDTGDHISYKNNYYSELTGIYWVWKNWNCDIVGTSHYRRFFTLYPIPFSEKIRRLGYCLIGLKRKRYGLVYTSNMNYWGDKLLTCNEAEELLKDYDAILPQPRKLKYSIEKHFERYHHFNDLQLLRTIVAELYPEFLDSLDEMKKQNRLYANNMLILKWGQFDELCNWLFTILFEFEKRVSLENYIGYQERIFGFLSERLITLWFFHHKLKVKELPLVYFKHFKFQK